MHWVHPDEQAIERNALDAVLSTWRQAHARGDIDTLSALQTPDYNARTTQLARQASATAAAQTGIKEVRAQVQWRNVSVFRWTHQGDVAIVNYTTVSASSRAHSIDRRQYWSQDNGHWRLFFDGMV
ncbi:MAG: hypothetical protein RSH07_07025 [Comamonas sp.]